MASDIKETKLAQLKFDSVDERQKWVDNLRVLPHKAIESKVYQLPTFKLFYSITKLVDKILIRATNDKFVYIDMYESLYFLEDSSIYVKHRNAKTYRGKSDNANGVFTVFLVSYKISLKVNKVCGNFLRQGN